MMATRRREARCWKSQVSAKAPRPRRRIARWVGEDEEVEDEAVRVNERRCRGAAAAADDEGDGFFFVLLFFATPRSSSRVRGGRVQRFPIARTEKKRGQ